MGKRKDKHDRRQFTTKRNGIRRGILYFHLACSLSILSISPPVFASAAGPMEKAILKFDFENPAQIKECYLNSRYASVTTTKSINGKASLIIDTSSSSSEWNTCFKTPPGLLKGGGNYIIDFKCRNLSIAPGSYLFFMIKPFDDKSNYPYVGRVVFRSPDIERSFRVSFHLPMGVENYSFLVGTRNKAIALVDDIRILRGGFLSAQDDKKPFSVLNIPTGCTEFQVELPKPKNSLSVSVAEFGAKPDKPDNTQAFNDAIKHCKESGISRLTVPKGIYRFNSEVSVHFEKLKDFEFDGQESTFVFHKRKKRGILMKIYNCKKVLFKNFNIDWDWDKNPLASFVKVVGVDSSGDYADFKFVNYKSFPKRNIRVADIHQMDIATMSVGCEDAGRAFFEVFPERDLAPKTEWLSSNVLRVHSDSNRNRFNKFKVGALFLMRHYSYDMYGILTRSNVHLTLSDVNIYSCPGTAIRAQGEQHHWQLLNVNVKKPPYDTTRPITSTCDGLHVEQSLGYLKLDGCEFSFTGDDCINVHDSAGVGVKSGPNVITAPKITTSMAQTLDIGNLIELRNPDYSPTGFASKIVSKKVFKSGYKITFENPLPKQKGEVFIMFNRRFDSSNIIIRNCSFRNHRARGILLYSNNITVEDNSFFHDERSAIMIMTGYSYAWAEGYGASNIVIRNNSFDTVGLIRERELSPVIYISAFLKTDPSAEKTQYPIFHDILIKENKFINCPGAIVYASSVKNLIVCDNTIMNSFHRKTNFSYSGAVGTAYSSEIYVTNNNWIKSQLMPRPGLFYDKKTSRKVYCWENKILIK
jgi:Right handed beta helix region